MLYRYDDSTCSYVTNNLLTIAIDEARKTDILIHKRENKLFREYRIWWRKRQINPRKGRCQADLDLNG